MLQAWQHHNQQIRHIEGVDGRIDRVTEKQAGGFQYNYTAQGDLQTIVEADGSRRRFEYDNKRRLHRVRDNNKVKTVFEYDAQDRLSSRASYGKRILYQHDHQGRLCRQQWGNDQASLYSYNEDGRLSCARNNQVTNQFQYGKNGKLEHIRQTQGNLELAISYQYDKQGRLSSLFSDKQNWQIQYEYDSKGQLKKIHSAGKTIASFQPQADGELRIHIAGSGYVQHTMNPRLKRLIKHQVSQQGQRLLERKLTYGKHGTLQSDSLREYQYDALDRLSTVAEHLRGKHWRYQYDSMDRRTSVSFNDHVRSFRYDVHGALATTHSAHDTMQYLYDEHGRLTARQDHLHSWRYVYDDADHLTRVYHNNALAAQFSYDYKGRLVAVDSKQRHERYLYGADDELIAVTDAQGLPLRLMIHGPWARSRKYINRLHKPRFFIVTMMSAAAPFSSVMNVARSWKNSTFVLTAARKQRHTFYLVSAATFGCLRRKCIFAAAVGMNPPVLVL